MFNISIVIVKMNVFLCEIVLLIRINILFVFIIVYLNGYERGFRFCEHLPLRSWINLLVFIIITEFEAVLARDFMNLR